MLFSTYSQTSKWVRTSGYFGEPPVMRTPHVALNCLINCPPSGNNLTIQRFNCRFQKIINLGDNSAGRAGYTPWSFLFSRLTRLEDLRRILLLGRPIWAFPVLLHKTRLARIPDPRLISFFAALADTASCFCLLCDSSKLLCSATINDSKKKVLRHPWTLVTASRDVFPDDILVGRCSDALVSLSVSFVLICFVCVSLSLSLSSSLAHVAVAHVSSLDHSCPFTCICMRVVSRKVKAPLTDINIRFLPSRTQHSKRPSPTSSAPLWIP